MTNFEFFGLVDSLMPGVIGGTLAIFALVGLREFFKEALEAFVRQSHA